MFIVFTSSLDALHPSNFAQRHRVSLYNFRVAAFGQPAGYVGMAVGLLTWAHQKLNNQTEKDNSTLPPLNYYSEYKQLLEVTRVNTSSLPSFLNTDSNHRMLSPKHSQ
jgi:hypothetical protein